MRNRVFHHERIIHWTDLDQQHADILEIIGWMSPPLRDLSQVLDRYAISRKTGLQPWLDKLHLHWPDPSHTPTTLNIKPTTAIVPETFPATNGAKSPFGQRWGSDVFSLSKSDIQALLDGQTLALDIQSEYVAFVRLDDDAKQELVNMVKLGGAGDAT